MRDLVESSEEPDSIPTGSIQSKGKGMEEALTPATHWQALISHKTLFISRFLLVATAAELKFPSLWESSVLCSRVLHRLTLLVAAPTPLVCLHLLSVGAARQFVCAPPGPNAFVNSLLFFLGPQLWPWYLGTNVSVRLWRLIVINYLQTPLSDI